MPAWKKFIIILWCVSGFFLLSVILLILMVRFEFFGKLPSHKEIENPVFVRATQVFSSDGKLLGTFYIENRVEVPYTQIPKTLINALIAIEDERFYSHWGVDLRGILRAMLFIGKKGGGSTISQQLAKLMFHKRADNPFKRIIQKIKEWILAVELEKRYSKEEIISMYLNKFDFLYNAVGVANAARVYFGKELSELSLAECASIAAMMKNPYAFNPIFFPQKNKERRNTVLRKMLELGMVTAEEYEKALNEDIRVKLKVMSHNTGIAPYFRSVLLQYVTKILNEKDSAGNYKIKKPDGSPYNIYKDGLKIYTTINYKLQEYAEEATIEHLKEHQKLFFKDLQKRKNFPFDWRISKKAAEEIITQAILNSDRFKVAIGEECMVCGRRGTLIDALEIGKGFKKCIAPDCGNLQKIISRDSAYKSFFIPVKMTIYTPDGEKDTVMTPVDSIKYHKAILQAGVIVIDHHTGEILAWVGGTNYKFFKYDHVMQSSRQTGSAFKPIVYAAAINEGFTPSQQVMDAPVVFEKDIWGIPEDWSPKNADGVYRGPVTLEYALANSINSVTAYLVKTLSPQRISDFAKQIGIKTPIPPVPSIALGTIEMPLIELTPVIGIFASKGIYCTPFFIKRIEDDKGNILYQERPRCYEVVNEAVADSVKSMLAKVVDGAYNPYTKKWSGTGVRLRTKYGIKIPVIGKTGTTQFHSDGWFIGATNEFTCGVWVGAEDRAVRFSRMDYGQGASMALPIFALFCKKVYSDSSFIIQARPLPPSSNGASEAIEGISETDTLINHLP